MCKLLSILLFSFIIVISVLFIKYKPAYIVTFAGENLGYVNNKNEINNAIEDYVNNTEGCIAYIDIEETPEYEFKFIDNTVQTNETVNAGTYSMTVSLQGVGSENYVIASQNNFFFDFWIS